MSLKIVYFYSVLFVNIFHVSFSEWIEIPQSSKKSFLVTPYTPYIYTPSLVFTSTTTKPFETMRPLIRPRVKENPKKSITKMPDEILQRTTTDFPTLNKHENKFNVTKSKVENRLKRPHINRRKDESSTFPSSITDIPQGNNKKFQVNNEEAEEEELEEEYEQVYDDDEDHYIDENDEEGDDENEENGEMLDASDDDYYDDDEYEDNIPVEEPKGNAQPNPEGHSNGFSYANFLPYLQTIQSTLLHTSHPDTVHNKVSFLNDIKNRLLYTIHSRINSIWEPRVTRQKRTTRGDMWESWDKSEHGMQFPSNEGALLTLGFLTFAVFLIKCILKLIHQIKGKHHNGGMTQIIIQNGTAAPATNTFRFKRDIDELEIPKFMASLDSYKPH